MTQPRLGVRFDALVPKKPVVDLQVPNRVTAVMRQGGGDLIRERRTYPPAKPWKSRPPKTGPRAGGRRTGQLARGWTVRFGRAHFDVFNPTPYAGYVQGFKANQAKRKKQTGVMAQRGWRSFDEDINRLSGTLGPNLRKAFRQRRR